MSRSDCIVVGGGMVGAAAAALLARLGLEVALVDAAGAPDWNPDAPEGLRVSAISPGSARILDQAGAWAAVRSARHCDYRRMRVEDGQGAGVLDFEAAVFGLEHLGTIVENDLLLRCLWNELEQNRRVSLLAPARLGTVSESPEGVQIELDDGRRLEAGLLIGCDGSGSRVRRAAGIRASAWEYNQKGVVARVTQERPNPGTAWQRFLPGGPLALLPLADGASSMVWTLPSREADTVLGEDDAAFRERLGAASNGFLGKVDAVGPRGAFPLSMQLSDRYVAGRLVLLGDAVHVVHPLAGQGVNLGLADVAALVECLAGPVASGEDLAGARTLARFDRWRRSESALMAGGVHALGALFRPAALSPLRRLGMGLVNRSWMLRDGFLRRAAGLGPNAPRLARGVALRDLASRDS